VHIFLKFSGVKICD